MAQPLSKLSDKEKEYSIQFDPECMQQEPRLAILVAETIARWSSIENALKYILIKLLGSQARPSFAMFSTLQAISTQITAIQAAGNVALSGEDLNYFNASLAVSRSISKKRHKLAHWVWGNSPQVPDALLLGDPDHMFEQGINVQQFSDEFQNYSINPKAKPPNADSRMLLSFDFDQIYVYREGDLLRIQRDFKETQEIVGLIGFLIGPNRHGLEPDELRRQLSNLPLLSEALARAQKNNLSIQD